jgi:hypothetical protein
MTKIRRCYHHCHGPLAVLFGVRVDDPVESEAACDRCKEEHPSRRDYQPPQKWAPEHDQADGREE